MSKLLVKYLAGWIKAETMTRETDGWLKIWLDKALTAQNNGRQLVVFELPENADLGEIEKYFQERYK